MNATTPPSVASASAIATPEVSSSSIVPVASASVIDTPAGRPSGADSVTVKSSSPSAMSSRAVTTVIVPEVSPAAMVRLPLLCSV